MCACVTLNISELSSNPIALALKPQQLKAVYLWRIYPPKLSNMIMSSSTPNECSKSSTVLDIIGGPLVRTALQQRTRLARWGCRRSSSSQKSADFWEPCLIGYLCGSSPMKKTVFDLLHSLDIKIQYIQ